jgi:hypothetical protein
MRILRAMHVSRKARASAGTGHVAFAMSRFLVKEGREV